MSIKAASKIRTNKIIRGRADSILIRLVIPTINTLLLVSVERWAPSSDAKGAHSVFRKFVNNRIYHTGGRSSNNPFVDIPTIITANTQTAKMVPSIMQYSTIVAPR